MKIVVCIKRIPATDTKVRLKDDGTLEEAGIQWITSPYDEYAVEMALRLTEKDKDSEVIIACMGPEKATDRIRGELARGATRAIHLVDDDMRRDAYSVAKSLASAIGDEKPDMVLCGRAAADDQSFSVGPMLGVFLGMPVVTEVAGVENQDGKLVAHKELDGNVVHIQVPSPVLLTTTKASYEPRYPKLKDIMKAKKKKIAKSTPDAPASQAATRTWKPPAPPAAGRIVGEGPDAVPELMRILSEDEKLLAL